MKKSIITLVCSMFSVVAMAQMTVSDAWKAMPDSILPYFIKRVSHPEPGIKPGDYYKSLFADFSKQVGEIIDQISNLG